MLSSFLAFRLTSRAALLTSLALAVCGCTSQGPGVSNITVSSTTPANASYDCGAQGRINIARAATGVRLTESDGSSFDLPASPPSQASRFGEEGLALVVENGEALWMKAGATPMTCRRSS
jgi:hypothetical protein